MFAPHPDDETFGCGGTIAKRISEGHHVLIVIMTDGRYALFKVSGITSDPSPEQIKEIRRKELKRAVSHLGVSENNLIFLDFVDGTLAKNEEEAEEKVVRILKNNRPNEIFFPFKRDAHPDHRATYRIVNNAVQKLEIHPAKYQYQIIHTFERIGPIIETIINLFTKRKVYVDISKFLQVKKLAIEEYKSEVTIISKNQQRPVMQDIEKFLKNKEEFYIERQKNLLLIH